MKRVDVYGPTPENLEAEYNAFCQSLTDDDIENIKIAVIRYNTVDIMLSAVIERLETMKKSLDTPGQRV